MQTIYLDISNKGVVPTVYAKQNDVGRKFAVILTDSGLPYIPEIGSVFSVWYKGASGEGNYTDIGNKSAFSLNGNKVEVEMIVQMLSAHGDGILCLTLNSPNGNQISSWNIPYICEIVPGFESEGAKEYYTAFSESVEKLKQVTENLTPEAIGASPMEYTKKVGNPHNLLDNSDFRNPVNQRGQTSYTSDHGGYTIDRWIANEAITLNVNTSSVTALSSGNTQNEFYQKIANPDRLLGKAITFATKTGTGTFVTNATIPSVFPGSWTTLGSEVDTDFGQIRVQMSDNSTHTILAAVTVKSGAGVTIHWAALYEGEYTSETLPEYQPKGYAAELAECMRYYQKGDIPIFATDWHGVYKGSTLFYIPMRVLPTMTLNPGSGAGATIDPQLITIYGCHWACSGQTYLASWAASADL